MVVVETAKHIIEITGGIKLFGHLPHVCVQCLLGSLTSHTLYATNEHYIAIVDKLKDADTILQIHDFLHILYEWAERSEVLIQIHL